MPGTTRYSATFDRPYEEDEDEVPAVPPLTRRSRSQSWQAPSSNSRPYTPLGGSRLGSHARSSSTDNGPQTNPDGSEKIPTRTAGKVSVKVAHNPFQFVKIGSCPLSRKAEEQLKKTQEKKVPEVLKEEEEEWQTNLDSWKNRRRKMSEHTIRRQEELKQLEMEEQSLVQPKKTKTFSEMLEERAHRGRAVSLSFFPNPLEMDGWNIDNVVNKDFSETGPNGTQLLSGGSEESSNMNSEDESDVFQKNDEKLFDAKNAVDKNIGKKSRRTGNLHIFGNKFGVNNGIFPCEKSNGSSSSSSDFKTAELEMNSETMLPHKDESSLNGMYIDSGLDSLSSSHRAGDIPDSGSDFSQDSGSSLDCDSPNVTGMLTTGMELLEEFSSKEASTNNGINFLKEKVESMELCLKLNLIDSKLQQFGFTINGGKDKGMPVTVASVLSGSVCDTAGLKIDDKILAINKEDISSLNHSAVISALKQAADNKQLELLLWRQSSADTANDKPNRNEILSVPVLTENNSKAPIMEESAKSSLPNSPNQNIPNKELGIKGPSLSMDANRDPLSKNKKVLSVKQKDAIRKKPAPVKPSTQELAESVMMNKEVSDELAPLSTTDLEKVAESENRENDEASNSSLVSNSKIPVAEKSSKYVKKEISRATQEQKKSKCNSTDKSTEILNNVLKAVGPSKDGSLNIIFQSHPAAASKDVQQPIECETINKSSASPTSVKNLIENKSLIKSKEDSIESPESSPTSPRVNNVIENRNVIESKESSVISSRNVEPKVSEKNSFNDSEITPVEKVAEEMERLILEQLEQEEKIKETNAKKPLFESHVLRAGEIAEKEHTLNAMDTPPRQLEPPKEKPPPPPLHLSKNNLEMDSSLMRVNSTKRIKKEIQKRRSDFLGIDNSEEDEPSLLPPPGLETILKAECEQERQVRQMLSTKTIDQNVLPIDEDEIAQKEREIIENLETEERKRMETQLTHDSSSLHLESSCIEDERIRKLKEERQRMEEERFLKEEQRIRLEEERQLQDREEQIRKQEDAEVVVMTSVLNSKSRIVLDDTLVTSESKQLPHVDESLCDKSGALISQVPASSSITSECNGIKESQSSPINYVRKKKTSLLGNEAKSEGKISNPTGGSEVKQSEINNSKHFLPKQTVAPKNKIVKKKIKIAETKGALDNNISSVVGNEKNVTMGNEKPSLPYKPQAVLEKNVTVCSEKSSLPQKPPAVLEKNETVCNEKPCIPHKPQAVLENKSNNMNDITPSALIGVKVTPSEVNFIEALKAKESIVHKDGPLKAMDSNSNCKEKKNIVKIRRKKNVLARQMSSDKEQSDEKSVTMNHSQNKGLLSPNPIGSPEIVAENLSIASSSYLEASLNTTSEQNSRLHKTHIEKKNDSMSSLGNSESNKSEFSLIKACEKVKQGETSDATTSSPSVAEPSTNPESSTSVSLLSSTSSGISCSQSGDGKNLNSSSGFPVAIDVSHAQGQSVNTTPPKPLKKKEVIRRERERLRQEQEALQREREEHRQQLLQEQERLKKDLPKSHAREDYTSYVGPPPPVKPALPLPLTPLQHPSQTLREDVIYTSRSFPGNMAAGPKGNIVALSSDHLAKAPLTNSAVLQSRIPTNEQWIQHKVSNIRKQADPPSESRYNQNHWLIQEAEMRRISEQNERQRLHAPPDARNVPQNQMQYRPAQLGDGSQSGSHIAVQRQTVIPPISCPSLKQSNYSVSTQVHSPEQLWNYGQPMHSNSQNRKCSPANFAHPNIDKIQASVPYSRKARVDSSVQPPTKPSRVIPVDRQDQMLSVSGRKRCSHCGEELGRGAAMIIESLQLYYHIHCFRCCVCQAQLGNGSCGTDVRVRNNKLHCHNCYSNDEAGLKFSQV